jgi:hypothetical protein
VLKLANTCLYSRGYKNCAIAEKKFETLAIFNGNLECCLLILIFYQQKEPDLHVGGFILTDSTALPQ